MRGIQEGQLDLLGTLFQRYSGPVRGRCYQLVCNRAEADDLLQESFLRVLRYRDSFQGKSRFSTWLYRIVTNVCIDHLKARGRQSTALDEMEEPATFAPADSDHRLDALRRALARLEPDKRELLLNARLHGWGYARIAAEYDITEGAARVRVHRAAQELKSIMDSLREGGR